MPRTSVPVEYTRGYRSNPDFQPPETIPTDRFKPPQPAATSSDDSAGTQQERDRAEQTDTPETDG